MDEYAVEGVDYTDWSSDEEDDEAAAGAEQVMELSCTERDVLPDGCAVAPGVELTGRLACLEQFQEFLGQVNVAIAQLGGKVLPKLNWSAPKVDMRCCCHARRYCHAVANCAPELPRLCVNLLMQQALVSQDAAWVSATNTTACSNADEVTVVLSSHPCILASRAHGVVIWLRSGQLYS